MKRKVIMLALIIVLAFGCSARADVEINATNFPSMIFRNFVKSNYDKNSDNILSDAELSAVTKIDVSGKGILSLTGIEHFINLKQLYCENNQLSNLDVSKNTKLTALSCYGNKFTGCDSTNNTSLKILSCDFTIEKTGSSGLSLNLTKFAIAYLGASTFSFVRSEWTVFEGDSSSSLARPEAVYTDGTKEYNPYLPYNNDNFIFLFKDRIMYFYNSGSKELSYMKFIFVSTFDKSYYVAVSVYPYTTSSSSTSDVLGAESSGGESGGDTGETGESGESGGEGGTSETESSPDIAPIIVTTKLADASPDVEYAETLIAYGTAPFTWSLTSGSLPKGLSLDASGDISGTPTEDGFFTFTVKAANKTVSSDTQELTLFVAYRDARAPEITTERLTTGYTNSPYGQKLTASGTSTGSTSLTWSADNLPEGMSLTTTGYLMGTPTSADTYTVTIQVSNSAGVDSKDFSLTVNNSPAKTAPKISAKEMDIGAQGEDYTYQLTATGTPPFTWTASELPSGLSMTDAGLITGKPSKKGIAYLVVTASNDFGIAKQRMTMHTYALPELNTTTLKNGTIKKKYNVTLKKAGSGPMALDLEGSLPDGLRIYPTEWKVAGTPKIMGTPTQNETTKFRLTLSNPVGEVSKVYSLNVGGVLPKITPTRLKDGNYMKPYKVKLKVSKGTKPMTMVLIGDLPAGLSFDTETLTIQGTPTEAVSDVRLTAYAANTAGIVSQDYTLTIKGAAPKFTTKALDDAKVNTFYSADVTAAGTPTITFTATGFPIGLSMDSTGHISGTPTEYGKFKVKVSAVNATKTTNKTYRLNVNTAPIFSQTGTQTLTSGKVGRSYKASLKAEGTKKITYRIMSGSLPGGINLNATNGNLKGKPTAAGTFNFVIAATNAVGTASLDCVLTIEPKSGTSSSAGVYADVKRNSHADAEESLEAEEISGEGEDVPSEAVGVETEEGGADESLLVVAELGEVSVDVSGLYDFAVTLSDDARAGLELVWLANSSEADNDDTIAEFYDADGGEVASVPEDRKVNISVWLNAGRVYRPAVAVKQ